MEIRCILLAFLLSSGMAEEVSECETGLHIQIAARGLWDKDCCGSDGSDPFFVLTGNQGFYRSCAYSNNHNPNWTAKITYREGKKLSINYRDNDVGNRDDDIGWSQVEVADLRKLKLGESLTTPIRGEGDGTTTIKRVQTGGHQGCDGLCWC